MTARTYAGFQTGINGAGSLTGANALDIAAIGIDLGIRSSNTTLLGDAYQRVHNEMRLIPEPRGDGIRFDGSFGYIHFLFLIIVISYCHPCSQHSGMLYNGNYGMWRSRVISSKLTGILFLGKD